MPVAPRIVNDVSYVSTISHDIHFAWHAQYLVRCDRVMPVGWRIVKSVSCFKRIDHGIYLSWQVQHLVMLEHDLCRSRTVVQ